MNDLTRTQRLLTRSPSSRWASAPAWRREAVERIARDRWTDHFTRILLEHMSRPLVLPPGHAWAPAGASDAGPEEGEVVDAEVVDDWDAYDPQVAATEELLGYHPAATVDDWPRLTIRERGRIWRERIAGAVSVLKGCSSAAPHDWKMW